MSATDRHFLGSRTPGAWQWRLDPVTTQSTANNDHLHSCWIPWPTGYATTHHTDMTDSCSWRMCQSGDLSPQDTVSVIISYFYWRRDDNHPAICCQNILIVKYFSLSQQHFPTTLETRGQKLSVVMTSLSSWKTTNSVMHWTSCHGLWITLSKKCLSKHLKPYK